MDNEINIKIRKANALVGANPEKFLVDQRQNHPPSEYSIVYYTLNKELRNKLQYSTLLRITINEVGKNNI